MKYRKGDVVSVLAIVEFDQDKNDDRIHLKVKADYTKLWMEPKDITLVQPKFEVGDECKWGGTMQPLGRGTILAIANDHAWIDIGCGDYCTRLLTSIERIDDESEV